MPELHERLSHLMNYSSQLIFVSGDTASEQQRFLNDFLYQQTDSEVSFFVAKQEQDASEWRRLICRQLAGQQVGSFVRPLSEQLDTLHGSESPYLICITQADNLTDAFLEELWDWVSNIQASRDKIHLNIILLGKVDWVQNSQEWLPKRNSQKPVLLSSQQVKASGKFDVNSLEQLMAEERFDRDRVSIIRKPLFIGSVLLLFLLCFITLLSWQYGEQIKAILLNQPVTAEPTPAFNINQDQFEEPLIDTESAVNYDSDVAKSNLSIITEHKEKDTASIEKEPLFASDWPNDSIVTEGAQTDSNSADEAQDYQVPDIVTVDDLNELRIEQSETSDSDSPKPTTTEPDSTITNRLDERYLLSLDPSLFVIQLSGIQNSDVLNTFIESNTLEETSWIYATVRYNSPWYVVLHNATYSSIESANAGIRNLPNDLRSRQPFVKSVAQIQQEITQPILE